MKEFKEKIRINIEVEDCTECPYYYGMIRNGLFYTYGKCEKTGGVGENKNLLINCPYHHKEDKSIDDYIETDHHSYWKLSICDYIDDLLHERLDEILKEHKR